MCVTDVSRGSQRIPVLVDTNCIFFLNFKKKKGKKKDIYIHINLWIKYIHKVMYNM